MAAEPKIVSARITAMPRPMPEGTFDPMPEVIATFDDGQEASLFRYYPDELRFFPSEFVGLTRREAHELKRKKDVAYLQS